jgi:hypothetical protein
MLKEAFLVTTALASAHFSAVWTLDSFTCRQEAMPFGPSCNDFGGRHQGTDDAVLNGELILKRFKLFKRHVVNGAQAPLGGIRASVSEKQQKALLAKKQRKQKVPSPPPNDDDVMKEIKEKLASSVPDGHPEKLILSMKTFCKSKAFQRSSAEGGNPDFSRKEIRLENRKQKLQEFEDS